MTKTEDKFNDVIQQIGRDFIDLYAEQCKRYPKNAVLLAMVSVTAAISISQKLQLEKMLGLIARCFEGIQEQRKADE
jgi:hypothetical protein